MPRPAGTPSSGGSGSGVTIFAQDPMLVPGPRITKGSLGYFGDEEYMRDDNCWKMLRYPQYIPPLQAASVLYDFWGDDPDGDGTFGVNKTDNFLVDTWGNRTGGTNAVQANTYACPRWVRQSCNGHGAVNFSSYFMSMPIALSDQVFVSPHQLGIWDILLVFRVGIYTNVSSSAGLNNNYLWYSTVLGSEKGMGCWIDSIGKVNVICGGGGGAIVNHLNNTPILNNTVNWVRLKATGGVSGTSSIQVNGGTPAVQALISGNYNPGGGFATNEYSIGRSNDVLNKHNFGGEMIGVTVSNAGFTAADWLSLKGRLKAMTLI